MKISLSKRAELPKRNGCNYERMEKFRKVHRMVFKIDSNETDKEMGVISKYVLLLNGHRRSEHSINSFTAV